jgi:hypothetical protein
VGEPEGWFIPASAVRIEVEARNGTKVEMSPHLPVPFSFAWAYRVARRTGVPVVSDIDPDRIRFGVKVPGA